MNARPCRALALGLILLAHFGLKANPLDPCSTTHIPIGIANTVDTLKTFVEAEGSFSPGFGSYGIYFWIWDHGKLTAPTMDGVVCDHGLAPGGLLIPWSCWKAGDIAVRTEVCQITNASPLGTVFVVGARAQLRNTGSDQRALSCYVALRSVGPAGWPVKDLALTENSSALLVDGHPAVVAESPPQAAGVSSADDVGQFAAAGKVPPARHSRSEEGDCSGVLRFDVELGPGNSQTLNFVCPVLPGRRAVGHQWDNRSEWAQFDETPLNPVSGGSLQSDPGLNYYRKLRVDELFSAAAQYWRDLACLVTIEVPDTRWADCFHALAGHVLLNMNEGAPDVAVVNYNVFNRDGAYIANILQKSGQPALAAQAIDYLLRHPFNGRIYPEADNPGQILWVAGEHWRITRDKAWLDRVYPSLRQLAAMIEYYRNRPGPHWVCPTSLEFGSSLPKGVRQELKPGRCDGFHPEYTEAFDIAGLRAAEEIAAVEGDAQDAAAWGALSTRLFELYDQRFGRQLDKEYGSYSVLWPCRLYPLDQGKAHEQFGSFGAQKPAGWRYFPLARAHQALLAGNRLAGYGTISRHLDHDQMRGWFAFDEGGESGTGGWNRVRTPWKQGKDSVAMPHGWAIAEVHLLLRDCLVFEDRTRLVLFGGLSPEWFVHPTGFLIRNMPTAFGPLSARWSRTSRGAHLDLEGMVRAPGGFLLRLPEELHATVFIGNKPVASRGPDGFLLDPSDRTAEVRFSQP